MENTEDRLVDINYVAKKLDIKKNTIYQMCQRNEFDFVRIGKRCIRFRKNHIDSIVSGGSNV